MSSWEDDQVGTCYEIRAMPSGTERVCPSPGEKETASSTPERKHKTSPGQSVAQIASKRDAILWMYSRLRDNGSIRTFQSGAS